MKDYKIIRSKGELKQLICEQVITLVDVDFEAGCMSLLFTSEYDGLYIFSTAAYIDYDDMLGLEVDTEAGDELLYLFDILSTQEYNDIVSKDMDSFKKTRIQDLEQQIANAELRLKELRGE